MYATEALARTFDHVIDVVVALDAAANGGGTGAPDGDGVARRFQAAAATGSPDCGGRASRVAGSISGRGRCPATFWPDSS